MEILDFEKYKATIHSALLSRIDLEKLAAANNGKARQAVAVLVQEIVLNERVPLNATEARWNPTCSTMFRPRTAPTVAEKVPATIGHSRQ